MRHGHAQDRELVGLAREGRAGGHHVAQLRDVGRHLVAPPPLDLAVVLPVDARGNSYWRVACTGGTELSHKRNTIKQKHNRWKLKHDTDALLGYKGLSSITSAVHKIKSIDKLIN